MDEPEQNGFHDCVSLVVNGQFRPSRLEVVDNRLLRKAQNSSYLPGGFAARSPEKTLPFSRRQLREGARNAACSKAGHRFVTIEPDELEEVAVLLPEFGKAIVGHIRGHVHRGKPLSGSVNRNRYAAP